VKEIGDLECPVEAVEGAAEVEVLESFLAEQSIAQNSDGYCPVPPFLVGFVDLQPLLQLHSVLNCRSASYFAYFLGRSSLILANLT